MSVTTFDPAADTPVNLGPAPSPETTTPSIKCAVAYVPKKPGPRARPRLRACSGGRVLPLHALSHVCSRALVVVARRAGLPVLCSPAWNESLSVAGVRSGHGDRWHRASQVSLCASLCAHGGRPAAGDCRLRPEKDPLSSVLILGFSQLTHQHRSSRSSWGAGHLPKVT